MQKRLATTLEPPGITSCVIGSTTVRQVSVLLVSIALVHSPAVHLPFSLGLGLQYWWFVALVQKSLNGAYLLG